MKETKGLKLPSKEAVAGRYIPSGIIAAWIFKRRLQAVLEECGAATLSERKLLHFQDKYGPSPSDGTAYSEFVSLTIDMVSEYREAIGAESYLSVYERNKKDK